MTWCGSEWVGHLGLGLGYVAQFILMRRDTKPYDATTK